MVFLEFRAWGWSGLTLPSVAVVERVDSCASMYSRSIQGHHVCLLVKKVSLWGLPGLRSLTTVLQGNCCALSSA